MTPEQEEQLNSLQSLVIDLSKRLDSRDEQQIKDPLDRNSQAIVYKDVLLFKRTKPVIVTAKGIITIEINGKEYNLLYT